MYDSDRDQFGGISIFEFNPQTFALTKRIYAQRAHWAGELGKWVFESGWTRSFEGSAIAGYQPFDVSTFAELSETPFYFKKEVKQSSEMEYAELRRYIHDLQQSGFDTVRLRVQLQKKLAYPLITTKCPPPPLQPIRTPSGRPASIWAWTCANVAGPLPQVLR